LTDIVRVADEYYVRASSALADDRTRVLKYGDTFGVFNRYGDIEAFGPAQFGLFHAEARHLSPTSTVLRAPTKPCRAAPFISFARSFSAKPVVTSMCAC
jgi:hypothetical protein